MTDEQSKLASGAESAHEVDRIREIIFGPQMRDYQQRFHALQRDLDRLQQEINGLGERLSEQGSGHTRELQGLRQEMRRADEDLRDEFRETAQKLAADKVDRVALGELFIELGNQLKSGGSLADLLQGLTDTDAG